MRAMPVVMRIERAEPPGRTALLEAAASAAVAVCLDPRAQEGGEWHDELVAWVDGRIRKVARRARGAHWAAVQALPGVTITVPSTAAGTAGGVGTAAGTTTGTEAGGVAGDGAGPEADGAAGAGLSFGAGAEDRTEADGVAGTATGGGAESAVGAGGVAQVRALVPGLVSETPKEVSRLQISGSDLPLDEPGPPPDGVPVLWLNPAVEMTVGKAAAQVGHATMLLAALQPDTPDIAAWAADGFRVAVRTPSRSKWAALHPGGDPAGAWRSRGVVAVRDAGFTEIAPGTVTVLAQLAPAR